MKNNLQKRKVISDKSFEYIWFLWKTVGLYRDEKYSCLQKAHVGFIIACVHGMTILTFIIQFFHVENLKQLLNILPMNVTVASCLIKLVIFLDKRHEIVEAHDIFAKLDSKNLTSEEIESLEKLNRFCRKIFAILFVLYGSMITSAAINAAFSHRQTLPFDIWLPYDYRSEAWLYWTTFAFQYSFFMTMVNENAACDLIGPLYFILLNRHLEIILNRIEKVGWDKEKTQEENYQDFIDCIEDHKLIMGIFDILQNTISPTLFVQFITSGVLLSMQALLYLLYPPNPRELAIIVLYTLDVTLEVFPCCYYCNNFMAITDRTVTSIFSSNFTDQSLKFKKTAIIFMQMTQKSHVVVAGKIFPVTLPSCLWVMKVAYSLLTVATKLR